MFLLGILLFTGASLLNSLSALAGAPSAVARVAALVDGFRLAFLVGAFLMVGGAVLLAATVRRADVARIDNAVEESLAAWPWLAEDGCRIGNKRHAERRKELLRVDS